MADDKDVTGGRRLRLQVLVTDALVDQLEEVARADAADYNEVVRTALRDYLPRRLATLRSLAAPTGGT